MTPADIARVRTFGAHRVPPEVQQDYYASVFRPIPPQDQLDTEAPRVPVERTFSAGILLGLIILAILIATIGVIWTALGYATLAALFVILGLTR